MSHPKCSDIAYIDFLIASPRSASCCEAARSQPPGLVPPTHDAYTRLLTRLEPDPDTLFAEVEPLVSRHGGVLVLDDSTLEHPYAREIKPVHRHWSGKHKRVVWGINLISLVWSDGDRTLPVDYRVYDKPVDGLTKNDHFQAMLRTAKRRGFSPRAVLFDSWYSGMENLKLVRAWGWVFLTQLKANRKVDLDRRGYRPVAEVAFDGPSAVVHLEGFGAVRVFRVVSRDGDTEYWATNDLGMDELGRLELAERSWAIEEYHRALKQCCNIERCQARSSRAQRNHIGMAIRAFARLSWHFYTTGVSWYESKAQIVREAIRAYRLKPMYKIPLTA
ncbi:MAG: transposase [Isosphaeraceae bacterium]|nr:transposase [Isosphaeraceae bacterium]